MPTTPLTRSSSVSLPQASLATDPGSPKTAGRRLSLPGTAAERLALQPHFPAEASATRQSANLRPAASPPAPELRRRAMSRPSAPTAAQAPVTARRRMSLPYTAAEQLKQGPSLLDQASALLNADRPREALALMTPHQAGYRDNYAFQCRLGNAHMSVVDELVSANALGALVVTPGPEGNWLGASVQAQRIACYVGVLGAYGRALELLNAPTEQAWFVAKNGKETLKTVVHGISAAMVHAMIEPKLLLHKICLVNSNKASRAFVERALHTGMLSEEDAVVASFREVAADPLYDAIAHATSNMQAAAHDAEDGPQIFWLRWAENQKAAFDQRNEVQQAARFIGMW